MCWFLTESEEDPLVPQADWCRFRKQIAVFSPESVQAVHWLPKAEHSPERERERERERARDRDRDTERKRVSDTER